MTTTGTPAPVIRFVGRGDQGAPMARAVGESRFDLHVWARRPQSLDAVAGVPHTVHADLASLAGAVDVLLLCLRDDQDVRDVLDSPGVRAALRPGTIVVNHGTGDPGENRRMATELAALDVAFLDAPVSGGGAGARAGALTTIVGGDRAAFDRCEPVFATFSRTVAHMGGPGTGQTTKLLNNAMTMSNLLNAEALVRLAADLGVGIRAVLDVVGVSSGGSTIMRALGTDLTPEIAPHLQGLMRKDIEHFADAVRAAGLDPSELRARGLAGADGLLETVTLIEAEASGSER